MAEILNFRTLPVLHNFNIFQLYRSVLGQDASGIVEAIGPNVPPSLFKVGDRVFTTGSSTGTYAHHCLVNFTDLHKLPLEVSFEEGAALGS